VEDSDLRELFSSERELSSERRELSSERELSSDRRELSSERELSSDRRELSSDRDDSSDRLLDSSPSRPAHANEQNHDQRHAYARHAHKHIHTPHVQKIHTHAIAYTRCHTASNHKHHMHSPLCLTDSSEARVESDAKSVELQCIDTMYGV